MAMTLCLECKKPVSSEAAYCPSCGAPPAKFAPGISTKVRPARKQELPMWANVAIAAVVVFFGVRAVWHDTSHPNTDAVCGSDLQCAGDRAVVGAGVKCREPVERLASHSVRCG